MQDLYERVAHEGFNKGVAMLIKDTAISNNFLPQFELVIDFTPMLYQRKFLKHITQFSQRRFQIPGNQESLKI